MGGDGDLLRSFQAAMDAVVDSMRIADAAMRRLSKGMADMARTADFGGQQHNDPEHWVDIFNVRGRRLVRYALPVEQLRSWEGDPLRVRSSYRAHQWLAVLLARLSLDVRMQHGYTRSDDGLPLNAKTLRRIVQNRRSLCAAYRLGDLEAMKCVWRTL